MTQPDRYHERKRFAAVWLACGIALCVLLIARPGGKVDPEIRSLPQQGENHPDSVVCDCPHVSLKPAHQGAALIAENMEEAQNEIQAVDPAPFAKWLGEWKAGTADRRQGLVLAQERSRWMQRLIQQDPETAYQQALDKESWLRLPEEIREEVAYRFYGDGTYEVRHDCESDQTWRHLTMKDFSTGQAIIAPKLDDRISFTGKMRGVILRKLGALVAMEGETVPIKDQPLEPTVEAAPVTGTFAVLWLNIRFSDEATGPSAGTSLSDAAAAFNLYSYGRLTLTYDVASVGIAATKASNPSDSTIQSQAKTAAQALGYNPANYKTILYRQSLYGQYAGLSNSPGYVMLSKSVKETNVHEIAHTMGVHHANWWKANTGQPAWGAGVNQLYGEDWDAMAFDNPRGDFNVPEKIQLGWLDQTTDYVHDVGSGTYRIYDYRSNSRAAFSTSGVNGAYFGVSVFKDTAAVNGETGPRRYLLSYRDRTSVGATVMTEGLYLHWPQWTYNGSSGLNTNGPYGSDIIDTHTAANAVNDAPLSIGETYVDNDPNNRDGDLFITALKKTDPDGTPQTGDEYIDVKVVVGDQVGNSPPTGTLAAVKSTVIPGETVVMSVTASDPNGDALAYLWDFGLGTTTAARNQMPLNGLPNQQFTYAAEGAYTVKVTVSDCRGGTVQLTKIITVSNNPPVVNAGADQSLTLGSAAAWTPADISTIAWYDATDATLVPGSVAQWNDKSGNNRHVLQATATKKPTYNATGWNGSLPSLTFDGGDALTSATISNVTAGERTVFIVYDSIATPTVATQYLFDCKGAVEQYYYAVSASVPSLIYKGSATSSSITTNVTGKHVVAFGNDARTRIYKDGTIGVDNAVNQIAGNSITQINVGSRGGSEYFQGAIAEVIVVPFTMTDLERQVVEGYLAHKWALTDNLPVGHPYKTMAPGGSRAVASLSGVVTDQDSNQPMTTKWSPVSGPGPVSISNPFPLNTTAIFTVPGTYTMRLTANDSFDQAFDEMVVTVSSNFTITASAGSGGSISPGGATLVGSGANQSYAITPSTGYSIADVLVDGASVGAVASYTFTNVTASHTIAASFAINQYTVTFQVGSNGSRTGGGALVQTVSHGGAATPPVISANTGYVFTGWDSSAYANVTANLTITAQYALGYTVSHSVPHTWLATQNAGWTADYESAAMADPDGDGFPTWKEYWFGTDPQDRNSYFHIDSIDRSGSTITIQWRNAGISGSIPDFTIQTSNDLSSGSWTDAGSKTPGNGVNTWTQSSAAPAKFYRLKAPDPP